MNQFGQRPKSLMFTVFQSSCEVTKAPEAVSLLKPWYYKPKKSLFRVDDDQAPIKKRQFNSLHWSLQENMRYASFLATYISLVQSNVPEKRKFHLNRMMSKHIKSRSPQQCRSHHQKMLKSFKTIEDIIKHFTPLNSSQAPEECQPDHSKSEAFVTEYVEESKKEAFLNNSEIFIESKRSQEYQLQPLHSRYQDIEIAGDSMFYFDVNTFPFLESQSL